MYDAVKEINKLYGSKLDDTEIQQLGAALAGDAGALQAIRGWSKKISRTGEELYYVLRYGYVETSESSSEALKHFIYVMDAIDGLKSLINLYSFSEYAMERIAGAFTDDEFIDLLPRLFVSFDIIGHNYPIEALEAARKKNPDILSRIKATGGSLGFLAAVFSDPRDPDLTEMADEALRSFMAGEAKTERALFAGLVMLDGENADVNKVLSRYAEVNPDKIIGGLKDSLGQTIHKVVIDLYLNPGAKSSHSVNEEKIHRVIREFWIKSGLNPKHLIVYIMNYVFVRSEDMDVLFRIYGDKLEKIKTVIPLLNTRGQFEALAYLISKGEKSYLEPETLKKIDELFLEMAKPAESIKEWMTSGTGKIPDKLTKHDMNFTTHMINQAGKILAYSNVAARYLDALMVREYGEDDWKDSFGNEPSVQQMLEVYLAYNKGTKEFPWFGRVNLKAVLWNMAWNFQGENSKRSDVVYEVIRLYPETVKSAFSGTADQKVYIVNHLTKDFDSDFLLSLLSDSSKKVADKVYKMLTERKDLVNEYKRLTGAKKKSVREYAEKLLTLLGGVTGNILEDAADKIATGGKADIKETDAAAEDHLENFDAGEYYKKYAKNIEKVIAWTNPAHWPEIRLAGSDEKADRDIVKYYVYQFINSKEICSPPHTKNIASTLEKSDLNRLATDIYTVWLEAGSSTKQKGVLALYCVNASESSIGVLKKQIDYWAENSRTAIASEALKSMLLSDTELAWMTVAKISKKYKYNSVKSAATGAIKYAAETLGISQEEMVDRTTPTLGFNQRGEKEIDFGTRSFTALLTPDLRIEISDSTGKKLRSLPAPGKADDATKAGMAKKDLAALKKSLEEIVKIQTENLERAISSRRMWTLEGWRGLFEKNPIMHIFAEKLVWGFYKKEEPENTFVYSNDGNIVDKEGDTMDFNQYEGAKIGLVHPIELSKEDLDGWKEYLSDMDIHVQPVTQLDRPIFRKSGFSGTEIETFGGKQVNALSLVSRLSKKGWYKSFGDYSDYYDSFAAMEKSYAPWRATIHHERIRAQVSYDEGTTVGTLIFSKSGQAYGIDGVPAIFFSEVMYDLTNATEKTFGFDENWKKKYTDD